jgi:hypothetical protein
MHYLFAGELLLNFNCHILRDTFNLGYRFDRRLFDAFQRFEMCHEPFFADFPDSFYVIQAGDHHGFSAQLPMICYRKPVCFIPDTLEQD